MPMYYAFGLNIQSDLALPGLPLSDHAEPDVTIELADINKEGLEDPVDKRLYFQASPDKFWLHVPGIAWFQVEEGKRIQVMPEENSDMQSVSLFLLGSCLGVILQQRQYLVMHANAIRFGDQCVIFAGPSGNGKSTLAAAFHQRGFEILADDVSAINEKVEVMPSYPQMKLWHDAATKLDIDTKDLPRVRIQIEKYACPLEKGFCNKPLPLAAMYILGTHNRDEFLLEQMKGMEKFDPIKNNTYRMQYLEGLGLNGHHLQRAGQLSRQINVTRIIRPDTGFQLDKLVDVLLDDLQTNGIKV